MKTAWTDCPDRAISRPFGVPILPILGALLVMLAAVLAHGPALDNGILNWDDPAYLDPGAELEFSPRGLYRVFSRRRLGLYDPLVVISHELALRVWSLEPAGHHAVNLALHSLNAALVFFLVWFISRRGLAALIAALLFAVHPITVEPVAWISGRNELLGAFFFLSSLLFYCRSLQPGGPAFRWRAVSLLFFLGALLSKASAVTLPITLILIDYCRGENTMRAKSRAFIVLLSGKIPYFILSAVFAGATLLMARSEATLRPPFHQAPLAAALVALRNLAWYPAKLLFPLRLSAYYPYPERIGLFNPEFLFSIAAVAAAALLIFILRRDRRLVFGPLFYAIAVFPLLQLVPIRDTIAADRYAYLPSVGLWYLLGVVVARFSAVSGGGRSGFGRGVLLAVLALAVAGLALLSRQRARVWADDLTLWTDVVALYPRAATPRNNLGVAYAAAARSVPARAEFEKAVALNPDFAEPRINLGLIHAEKGEWEEAALELEEAIALAADYPEMGRRISAILSRLEAGAGASRAVFAPARNELGAVLARRGRLDAAAGEFQRALENDPGFAPALVNLAQYWSLRGDRERAAAYRHAAEAGE